jgi:hypothetical protein
MRRFDPDQLLAAVVLALILAGVVVARKMLSF